MESRKLILFFALVSMFLLTSNFLLAQENNANEPNTSADQSEETLLVRSYNIRKIYSHRLGYRIDIINYLGRIRTIYAKISWFADPEQRNPESENFELLANMNFVPNTAPIPSNYLTMKYMDGKLTFMDIYVEPPGYSRRSIWDAVQPSENIDAKFDISSVAFSAPPEIPAGKTPEAEDQTTEDETTPQEEAVEEGAQN